MLTRAVETYLAVRRAAGFALRDDGPYLKSFAAFSEARKQRYVSTEIAIEWADFASNAVFALMTETLLTGGSGPNEGEMPALGRVPFCARAP